jgi:hypothetical protein
MLLPRILQQMLVKVLQMQQQQVQAGVGVHGAARASHLWLPGLAVSPLSLQVDLMRQQARMLRLLQVLAAGQVLVVALQRQCQQHLRISLLQQLLASLQVMWLLLARQQRAAAAGVAAGKAGMVLTLPALAAAAAAVERALRLHQAGAAGSLAGEVVGAAGVHQLRLLQLLLRLSNSRQQLQQLASLAVLLAGLLQQQQAGLHHLYRRASQAGQHPRQMQHPAWQMRWALRLPRTSCR